jgi:Domain of unknown function (DUF4404)
MTRQELCALLDQLHAELSTNPPVDAELKQALRVLDQDIQRVLSQPSEPSGATLIDPDVNVLVQTLETRLEVEHPYLVGTLRELVDRLGKMGI